MNLFIETRGFKNNNVGNIRHSSSDWKGLSDEQTDKSFCSFTHVEYGIRAIYRTLRTYKKAYNIKCVRAIIERWAPATENQTASYIKSACQYMSKQLGVPILSNDDVWEDKTHLYALIAAIIYHENGKNPFNIPFIEECAAIE